MKSTWTVWIAAGVFILSCKENNPQALIDQWNENFGAQKQACEAGNLSACQIACQMSINPQICETVKASANLSNPEQRAWVEQCALNAAMQGRSACAAAGLAIPPHSTQNTLETTPPPVEDPAEALRKKMENMVNKLQADQVQTGKKESELQEALMEAQKQGAEATFNAPSPQGVAFEEPAPENEVAQGSLPKGTIQKIIHRHQSALRFCYDTKLASNPNLSGKVTVKFVISGTGTVQMAAISDSTMNNPEVENCVTQAFQRMVFPQPEGGGIVVVTYPLQFKPAE